MSLNSNATILPGRGTVFFGDPDATPLDYKTVDPSDPLTFENYELLGHTSRENTVALSKDGGDATQHGSWWTAGMRESREPTQWSWTVNSLQVDRTTLNLAWPGGTVRDGAFWVPSSDRSIEKSAFILIEDASARMGLYFPRTPMQIGDAPELAVDALFEIQLQGSILSSNDTGDRIGIFHPQLEEQPAG